MTTAESRTVDQAEWDQWESERIERAKAERERTAWQRKQPPSTDHLTEQILDLETRLFFCGVLLASAVELLNRRAMELSSLRSLIRMDVALRAMEGDKC